MTRDEAVTLIANRLGYSSSTAISSLIISEMQLVQTTLEHDEGLARPWFLLTGLTDLTTTAGDHKVSLPSDFLAEYEEGHLWYYDTETDENPWVQLNRTNLDFNLAGYGGEEDGEPKAYSIVGPYLWIFPKPDAVYTLKLQYYAADAVLSSNIENDWLKYAPDLLIAETGMVVAQDLEHARGIETFGALAIKARDRFWRENEHRQHMNMQYVMGA